jgi:DNA-binding CsgD family transcriptional regulator
MLDAATMALERDRKRRENERAKSNLRIRFEALTPREREVMALVTARLMNKQIADEANLAEITVKIHRGHVMKKMAARSLADLVRMAEILDIRSSEQRCDALSAYLWMPSQRALGAPHYRTGRLSEAIGPFRIHMKEVPLAQCSSDLDHR